MQPMPVVSNGAASHSPTALALKSALAIKWGVLLRRFPLVTPHTFHVDGGAVPLSLAPAGLQSLWLGLLGAR